MQWNLKFFCFMKSWNNSMHLVIILLNMWKKLVVTLLTLYDGPCGHDMLRPHMVVKSDNHMVTILLVFKDWPRENIISLIRNITIFLFTNRISFYEKLKYILSLLWWKYGRNWSSLYCFSMMDHAKYKVVMCYDPRDLRWP